MTRFHLLIGDVNWREYGGKWISNRQNNGDWDYYLVMEVINMHDATGDENQPKYNVSLSAVSPEAAGRDKADDEIKSWGIEGLTITDEMRAEALHGYGVSALLWQDDGNNVYRLMGEARKQAQIIPSLFGFYMDRRQNLIGNSGWDFIAGDIGFKS